VADHVEDRRRLSRQVGRDKKTAGNIELREGFEDDFLNAKPAFYYSANNLRIEGTLIGKWTDNLMEDMPYLGLTEPPVLGASQGSNLFLPARHLPKG
jgi:hypothetical protein